jgi:hypothetical protein
MHSQETSYKKVPEFVSANINYNSGKRKKVKIRLTPKSKGGRPKGSANKITKSVRQMFDEFVHHNAANAQSWIDRVAKRDPAKALTILNTMADFVLPRKARTEVVHSGDPLISLTPISDPAEAAATYQSLLGNTKFDLSKITFAPPESSVVSEQGQQK